MNQGDFATALQAAFAADSCLNWLGGDVTLTAPIELDATVNKFSSGVNLNGAKITCNFNDATKYAISLVVPVNPSTGKCYQNVNVRGFRVKNGFFFGSTPFAGAIRMECRTNGSWIAGWTVDTVNCEGHSGRAFACIGSVFEGKFLSNETSGGQGAFDFCTTGLIDGVFVTPSAANNYNPNAGNPANNDTDKGLVSAIYIRDPDLRDASSDAILLRASVIYQEPFDLTVEDGYIVGNQGVGINAPAGITAVIGTGFESNMGGCAIALGYRGGKIIRARGANSTVNASNAPRGGTKYLVATSGGTVTMEDCVMVDENSGTGSKLAYCSGSTMNLNRCDATSIDVANNGTVKSATYA